MNQSAAIQQLTNRLKRIEAEIMAVRKELKALPEQKNQLTSIDETIPYAWVNKISLREQMQRMFLTLSIRGTPVGAELLQKQMHEAELALMS